MSDEVKYLTAKEVADSAIWGKDIKNLLKDQPQLKFTSEFCEVPLAVGVPTPNGVVNSIRIRRNKYKDNYLLGVESGLSNADAIKLQNKALKALADVPPEVIDEVDQRDGALLDAVVAGFLVRAQLDGAKR